MKFALFDAYKDIDPRHAPTGRLSQETLKLDLNEQIGVLDHFFLDTLSNMPSMEVLHCYPEYDALLTKLSVYTGVSKHQITLTNGADQAIDVLIRWLFGTNSRVVLPAPVFSMYDHVLSIVGAKVIHIPYTEEDDTFIFPIEKTLSEMEDSDGIIVCNPNNPVGVHMSQNDIHVIIKKSNELSIPCVVDEAYFEFCGQTSADFIKEFDNVIIIRTFSKVFGLAGLRLGYIMSSPKVKEVLKKIIGPWDVNSMAVYFGEAVLDNHDAFLEEVEALLARKERLAILLSTYGYTVYETKTNFLVIRHVGMSEIVHFFRGKDILITDIAAYPHNKGLLENAARIAIPTDPDFLRIESILESVDYKNLILS